MKVLDILANNEGPLSSYRQGDMVCLHNPQQSQLWRMFDILKYRLHYDMPVCLTHSVCITK